MKTTPFVGYVLEQLSGFGNVTLRSMFGGFGLYRQGFMFALIADDRLYFKVDASNKCDYQEAGCLPFIYDRHDSNGNKKVVAMSYWELPVSVLEDADALHRWAVKAHAAAILNKEPKHA